MVLGILVRLSPGNPVSPFLGAKVNTDVGHVSLPAFNLLAIAERGRIMRADSTASPDITFVDLVNLARNIADTAVAVVTHEKCT